MIYNGTGWGRRPCISLGRIPVVTGKSVDIAAVNLRRFSDCLQGILDPFVHFIGSHIEEMGRDVHHNFFESNSILQSFPLINPLELPVSATGLSIPAYP